MKINGDLNIYSINIFASVNFCGQYEGNETAFKNKSSRFIIKNEDFNIYPEFEAGIRYSLN